MKEKKWSKFDYSSLYKGDLKKHFEAVHKGKTQLKTHIDRHHGEKHTCSYCGQEYGGIYALTCHINRVHEKIPCAQCGKLVGIDCMNRHISSAHTPNDQKKYQCDVCPKGFSSLQHLRDHRNLHTGEKPYKCKFCPSCFASKGNHAMHEKGHLGFKRDQSKKWLLPFKSLLGRVNLVLGD